MGSLQATARSSGLVDSSSQYGKERGTLGSYQLIPKKTKRYHLSPHRPSNETNKKGILNDRSYQYLSTLHSCTPFLDEFTTWTPRVLNGSWCTDGRLLSVLLDFMGLSSDPTEDIATALAFLSSSCGQGRLVTTTAIRSGFRHYPRENLLRGTSVHVALLSEFTRCWGGKYLKSVLSKPVSSLMKPKTDVEIDLRKTHAVDLRKNVNALVAHVDKIIGNIITTKIPPPIKELLVSIHQNSGDDTRPPMSTFLIISSLLFLRFVCPALVSPELYGITKEKHIGSAARRKLILVAKILQSIANEVDPYDQDDTLIVLSDCIKDSIVSVREWSQSIFAAKLTLKSEEVKKAKASKLLPYRDRLCDYLQSNEDKLRTFFRQRMEVEHNEEERDYLQITLYRLTDALDERRREIGADPSTAQSYDKVWERVERRTNRLHKLEGMGSGGSMSDSDTFTSTSSGDLRARATVTTKASTLASLTEFTDDDGTGVDTDDDSSFIMTDDSCMSEKSEKVMSPSKRSNIDKSFTGADGSHMKKTKTGSIHPPSLSLGTSLKPRGIPISPRNRSKSVGDCPTVQATLTKGSSLGHDGGGSKLVFKCWRNNKRKIFTVPSRGISYTNFLLFLYRKLEIDSSHPLRLSHRAITPSGEVKMAINDELTFRTFLSEHGTTNESSTTYFIWVD